MLLSLLIFSVAVCFGVCWSCCVIASTVMPDDEEQRY